jgi:CBS domain containing-hemolysin-like protein
MATFIMTPVILIFGEIIPKTIFRQAADFLVPTIVLPLMIFYFLLSPIIFVAAAVTNCSLALLKEKKLKKTTFVSREEIAQFIEEGGQKSFLEEEKFKIIKRIFDFEGRPVAAIMVPFEQVVLLPADRTVAETLEATRNFKFSRFPVFEGERSAIVGFLEIKDLLAAEKNKSINSFLKPLLVVPAYKKIEEMLEDFISEKAQIARVVNESGQTTGIVTREDLIEEILGEIKDEFDR